MNGIEPYLFQLAPCVSLVPLYQQALANNLQRAISLPNLYKEPEKRAAFEKDRINGINQINAELSDPLTALRQKMALLVEKFFEQKKERTIILGCMHYPSHAAQDFIQTQTETTYLLPKNICRKEDHSHQSAVTVDLRYSPDEKIEILLEYATLFNSSQPLDKMPPNGPDFARRDFKNISHLEDFLFVKNIKKIYAERLPSLEKGPCAEGSSNIALIQTIHKLLGKGGIFAFDYIPYFQIQDSEGADILLNEPPPKREISQKEIDDFLKNSPHRDFFAKMKKTEGTHPSLACQHQICPATPCPAYISNVARSAIIAKEESEVLNHSMTLAREIIKSNPPTALTKEELAIKFGSQILPLADFDPAKLPLNKFYITAIVIKCLSTRTFDEMGSIYYQFECYRALNVNPSLASHIHPATKEGFDWAVTLLVEKVVFPQLHLLGFEKVSFDLNRQNPENKRLFERVIYSKKALFNIF